MSIGRKNKTLKKAINNNNDKQTYKANESKTQHSVLKQPLSFNKLPTAIINVSINAFLKTSEIAFLSQTNRLFNQDLSQFLARKKETIIKNYNEAISIDRLFQNVNPMGKLVVECQKAFAIGKLITQFRSIKESPSYDYDKYSKLILNHAYDLDAKNETASQLGGYKEDEEYKQYFPYLSVDKTTTNQECLTVKGLELTLIQVQYLAETYRHYYSPALDVKFSWSEGNGCVSFNLESFLKDVLPVILGLSPKPTLSNSSESRLCRISQN